MPNELWASVIGVGGTLAGVWVGAKLARNTALEFAVQQAKAEFSSQFTSTLVQLHSSTEESGIGEVVQILQQNFPAHLAAYLKLKASIPSNYHEVIEKAWSGYTKDHEHELKEEKVFYRFSHILNGKNDEEMRSLAIKHINALLKTIAKT